MVKEHSTCTLAGAWCFEGAGEVGKRTFSLYLFIFKIEGTRILLMEHTFLPKTVEVKNILLKKNLEV